MSDARPELHVIAAVAANGVIGRGLTLPWHLPDDLKHFKQLTLGHAIIMGRRTFESIGRALPGRQNIVVSTSLAPITGIEIVASLDDAIELAAASPSPAFVIGGAALYAAAIPLARVLHLTELDESVEGDVRFPVYDRSKWLLVNEQRHPKDERHAMSFRFCRYQHVPE